MPKLLLGAVALLSGLLLVLGLDQPPTWAHSTNGAPTPDPGGARATHVKAGAVRTYEVRTGDSLWRIARSYLGRGVGAAEVAREAARLERLNAGRLADPDLLLPGQRLVVPKASPRGTRLMKLGAGYARPAGSRAVDGLQRTLRRLGYAPGLADGRFGGRTAAAVRRFQQSRGLAPDGIVGPDTWHALRAYTRRHSAGQQRAAAKPQAPTAATAVLRTHEPARARPPVHAVTTRTDVSLWIAAYLLGLTALLVARRPASPRGPPGGRLGDRFPPRLLAPSSADAGWTVPSLIPASQLEPRVSVVIPTLNEAENLPHVLPRLPEEVYEVILVDGGSTDGTPELARRLLPTVEVIRETRRGKGIALICGFARCRGDIVVMIDADGSNDPGEIPRFVAALQSGALFAKGSRFLAGGGSADLTLRRRLGNRALGSLVNLLFGTHYTDLCYGYNAAWRRCLPELGIDCKGFEVETLMNIRLAKLGFPVAEVPSFEAMRIAGESKLDAARDGWRVLRTIVDEWLSTQTARGDQRAQTIGVTSPRAAAVRHDVYA
jgi:peptidoglycan hydrolase-like protein with peptidoglycan-binding domain